MVFPGLIYLLGPKCPLSSQSASINCAEKTSSQRILKSLIIWNLDSCQWAQRLANPYLSMMSWISFFLIPCSSCNSLQTWQEWHNHIWEVLMARPMKERRRWPRNINLATQSCMSTPARAVPTHNVQLKTVKQANNLVRGACYLKCEKVLVFRFHWLSTFLVTMS